MHVKTAIYSSILTHVILSVVAADTYHLRLIRAAIPYLYTYHNK